MEAAPVTDQLDVPSPVPGMGRSRNGRESHRGYREARDSRVHLNRTGLVFGTLLATCHVFWLLLVLIGWAQPLVNFVFWAHMIEPIYVIKPFDALAAISLLCFTFLSGYALGLVGAALWNYLHHEK